MKQFLGILNKYLGKIYRTLLFILSIALIVYLFPTEGKFRYEFQKGKPWLHADLIAPFDFAIKKTDKELKAEKDSILQFYKPYFKTDQQVFINQINQFNYDFPEKWFNYLKIQNPEITFDKKAQIEKNFRETENYIFCENLLQFIYKNGIIEIPAAIENTKNSSSIIVKVTNNIAEEVEVTDVFTQKTAYEYIVQKIIDKQNSKEKKPVININFIKQIHLDNYLQANLFYDEATSLKIQDRLLENISVDRGKVQKGERIVSKGEVVNGQKYKILLSLKHEYETSLGTSTSYYWIIAGQIVFVSVCILVMFLFLYNYRREILQNSQKTSFIIIVFSINIVAALLGLKIDTLISDAIFGIKSDTFMMYIIPFTILPVLIRTFYDARLALFIHIVAILLIGFIAPNGFEFVFVQFIAGVVAIFTLVQMHRRGQIFRTSALVFLSYSIVYISLTVMHEGSIHNIAYNKIALFAGNSLLLLFSYPLIWLFEKLFGFMSDVTLLELSDTNQPLLRELAEKAPGTFQHSMQVANLAEEAIYKIGGNPLLVRTGAFYHDIGKMLTPEYFIENQVPGRNPHDDLEFDESANIIIGHVIKGIEMAKKHNLPEPIIDFIRTHHGDSKVQYFYRSYLNKYPEKDVDVAKFTYPGPKPYSHETAALMMADSVEAASRSLKVINEKTLSELVENIIDYQIKEEQFADANITFRDITEIKRIFKVKLKTIYHVRIEYPEEVKQE